MRFLKRLALAVVAAWSLVGPLAATARADVPGTADPAPVAAAVLDPAPARPGTDAESRDYERREEASPEVRDFAGGHATLFGLIVFVAVILLIVFLAQRI